MSTATKKKTAKTPVKELTVYGVRIAYQEAGEHLLWEDAAEVPTLVFLHDWCSNRLSFKEQMNALGSKFHCIALDLPGHGRSSKPQLDYSIVLMAELVTGFVQKKGISKSMLVGHGLGAAVALEAHQQTPNFFNGIVMVSPAPLTSTSALRHELESALTAITENGYRDYGKKLIENTLFDAADRDSLKEWATLTMSRVPEYVGISALKGLMDWPGQAALRALKAMPLAMIASDHTMCDIDVITRYAPHLRWSKPMSKSHYCHLTSAAEVNSALTILANGFKNQEGD